MSPRSSLSGCVSCARLGVNFLSWFTIPMNCRNSETVVGSFISWMASVFSGLARMPVLINHMTEKLGHCGTKYTLLCIEGYSSTLDSLKHGKESGIVLCSISSEHQDIIHLHGTLRHQVQSGSCSFVSKCSGALEMPNGSLLKQYRPDGVMNVVSKRDAGEKGICQKPLFTSSLLNSLAPAS